jgi:hypothetical protein
MPPDRACNVFVRQQTDTAAAADTHGRRPPGTTFIDSYWLWIDTYWIAIIPRACNVFVRQQTDTLMDDVLPELRTAGIQLVNYYEITEEVRNIER